MGEEAGLRTHWGRAPKSRRTSPTESLWSEFAADVVLAGGVWIAARRTTSGDTQRSLRKAQPTVERLIIEEMIRTGARGEVEVVVAREDDGVAWLYARLIPAEISVGESV